MLIMANILQEGIMKKLLLLMVLLPFGAYCANTLTMFHINDGAHVLQQGQTFAANEIVVSNPNAVTSIQKVICTARDTASVAPVKVKWTVVVNDYKWAYTMDTSQILSWEFLPPANVVYKIVIKGVIDKGSYKGPYANIICGSYS